MPPPRDAIDSKLPSRSTAPASRSTLKWSFEAAGAAGAGAAVSSAAAAVEPRVTATAIDARRAIERRRGMGTAKSWMGRGVKPILVLPPLPAYPRAMVRSPRASADHPVSGGQEGVRPEGHLP